MKKIIYFILVNLFMSITYAQNLDFLNSELSDLNTSGLAEGLNGELFVGVDFGPGHIYKSTNSGIDWVINGNSVIWNAEHIVVNSSGHIFAAGNSAGIIRSTNDGLSWDQLSVPWDIRALAVAENDYLYIGVDDTPSVYIERSTDNGETWENISGIIPKPIYAIDTFSDKVYAGSDDGTVYYSYNSGTSWVQTALTGSNLITAISVNDLGDVFAGTWGDGVYRSTDFGSSWNKIFDTGECTASIITSVQGYLYIALGRFTGSLENIFRSSDNGVTWELSNNGVNGAYIQKMLHTTDNALYITTMEQGVFKSTNLGDEWFSVGPVTSIDNDNKLLPDEYELAQNYPNPFNPATKIKYQISELSFVTLKVYDVLGSEIATLVSEEKPSGKYEVDFSSKGLASGVYIYRMKVNDFITSKKMLLIK
jgi:photosystem II stability/assembly factor-like uncharacterized protein